MKDLMIEFLALNYPIRRIKVEGRFRRVMIIYTAEYLLSNNEHLEHASYALLSILEKVFGYIDKDFMKDVVIHHLGLR